MTMRYLCSSSNVLTNRNRKGMPACLELLFNPQSTIRNPQSLSAPFRSACPYGRLVESSRVHIHKRYSPRWRWCRSSCPVMEGISLSLSTADLARQQAQASSLAHDKLMELVPKAMQQPTCPAISARIGRITLDGQTLGLDGAVLRQLDVTVEWHHGGRIAA